MLAWVTYGAVWVRSKAAICAAILALSTSAQAETLRMLALGDSLTQGYGLPEDQGFVPRLEAWLKTRGHDVEIVNGGVSGDTTAGGLSRVDWSLADGTEAMIVALGGNDLLRGIDPAVARANLDGILRAAAARDVAVLLVGMRAPGNYGPEYKRAFDAIYPELAQSYGTLYFPAFFQGIQGEDRDPAEMRAFMQADGIHPNAEGVERIVDAMGPAVAELIDKARQ